MKDIQEIEALKKALMKYDRSEIEAAVNDCISAGIDARTIIDAIQDQMGTVGLLFEKGRLFLPQMMAIAGGTKVAMSVLGPNIRVDDREPDSKTVIMGTVEGDVHDIGKNICVLLFTASGFRVDDLGADVQHERFIEGVRDGAAYCGMSSLMTTSMLGMKEVIDDLESEGIREGVVVMVGGAPVTQAYADKIDADIYGETAFETLSKMRGMSDRTAFRCMSERTRPLDKVYAFLSSPWRCCSVLDIIIY